MNILVIDDNLTINLALQHMLRRLGCDVVVGVESGTQALIRLQTERFDLLFLDWMMPHMDGIEFLRHLRRDARLARIPVVMTTSKDQMEDLLTAMENGASDYIVKPASLRTLEAKLRKHLPEAMARVDAAREDEEAATAFRRKNPPEPPAPPGRAGGAGPEPPPGNRSRPSALPRPPKA